ncbi:PucR family transcriptional regulator [Paraclostridium bifermentans]|uniref:PucR family transcriptional regulator n=1 Tax=Paraclostridium bifermentans TaxID=1490 RepID=UPI00359CA3D6
MKGLINFFEEQLGKKVNIYKYKKGKIIKKSQQIVVWDNKEYIVEVIENNINIKLNGNFYLIYQKNINKEILDKVFKSLYETVNIIKYNGNYILNTNELGLIDENTPQIIETEVYEKTYIINLGTISNREEFDLKIDLANRLKRYIFIENSDRKYFDIYDLGIYNLIELVRKEKSYPTLFDYNLIDKVDNLVLETGIAFIENGFNISKTSNNIYLHRNTLIYRLEKIKDIMGMDIRNFNEALIYYVIVKDYLVSKNM